MFFAILTTLIVRQRWPKSGPGSWSWVLVLVLGIGWPPSTGFMPSGVICQIYMIYDSSWCQRQAIILSTMIYQDRPAMGKSYPTLTSIWKLCFLSKVHLPVCVQDHIQVGTGPIFSGHVQVNQWSNFFRRERPGGEVQFFPDFDCGKSGGKFENYAEPTTRYSLFLTSYSL